MATRSSLISNHGSGGSKGGAHSPNFFRFHAAFGIFLQNHVLAPPGELTLPPKANPGSATVK